MVISSKTRKSHASECRGKFMLVNTVLTYNFMTWVTAIAFRITFHYPHSLSQISASMNNCIPYCSGAFITHVWPNLNGVLMNRFIMKALMGNSSLLIHDPINSMLFRLTYRKQARVLCGIYLQVSIVSLILPQTEVAKAFLLIKNYWDENIVIIG